VTANLPASPAPHLRDALQLDLAASGQLPPLPASFLAGRDLDLLAPLGLLASPSQLEALCRRPVVAPKGRAELAAAIAASNHSFGHPDADRLCRRLADPATRVVVTGQQPGLFGGPLYTFSKMVAASRYAAALEAAGEPAVAVFWVANEDHDFAEVSHATVLAADGPRSFDLGPDPEPLLPVGMRTMPQAITGILRAMGEAVPGERYAEWLALLGSWYGPFACVGTAFCRSMTAMLGHRCPLLLDAMHPALKLAQRPYLACLIERRAELEAALERQDAAIAARGYELRVSPQRGASPLFLLRGAARRRIAWQGAEGFTLRGHDARPRSAAAAKAARSRDTVAELLRTVSENPSVVSPGVLARPAIADAVLGTTLQVLGPGELSYMPQVAPVYGVLDVTAPHVTLRPQAMVLDARQAERLAESGLELATLLGDRHQLDRALAERAGGDFVAPVAARIQATLAELEAPALAADANLERPLTKTREQIARALSLFAEKALPALARRDEVENRRVDTLLQVCQPGGKWQERVVSAAHFQGKYGDRFAASFWEQMDLEPRRLSVIVP
jgi:bacillithiol synthase